MMLKPLGYGSTNHRARFMRYSDASYNVNANSVGHVIQALTAELIHANRAQAILLERARVKALK